MKHPLSLYLYMLVFSYFSHLIISLSLSLSTKSQRLLLSLSLREAEGTEQNRVTDTFSELCLYGYGGRLGSTRCGQRLHHAYLFFFLLLLIHHHHHHHHYCYCLICIFFWFWDLLPTTTFISFFLQLLLYFPCRTNGSSFVPFKPSF